MKVKELMEALKDYQDFDIKTSISYADGSKWGVVIKSFQLKQIGDIGHSEKVLTLEFDFTELEKLLQDKTEDVNLNFNPKAWSIDASVI